jgi:hypothetical protein
MSRSSSLSLFDRSQRSARRDWLSCARKGELMSDAQIGLSIATPVIVIFAIMLYRMGVLQRTGVVTAVIAAIAIAASLFLQR